MKSAIKIGLPVALATVCSIWITHCAAASDFNAPGFFLQSGSAFALILVIRKSRPLPVFRAVVAILLAVGLVVSGIGLRNLGDYNRLVGQIVTRRTLEVASDFIKNLSLAKGDVPDLPYREVRDAIMRSGFFRPVEIPGAGGGASLFLAEIDTKDAWRCRYDYRRTAFNAFILRSSGPDRKWDTKDDIVVRSDDRASAEIRNIPMWMGYFHTYEPVNR